MADKNSVFSSSVVLPGTVSTTLLSGGMATDTENRAVAEAASAGIVSPGAISETHEPTNGELHNRLQIVENQLDNLTATRVDVGERFHRIEAMVWHIFATHFRNTNVDDIVKAYREFTDGSEVVNPNVVGPR